MAEVVNLRLVAGEHTVIRFTVEDTANPESTLAGATIDWWMASSVYDDVHLIHKTIGDGIEVVNAADRVFEVTIESDDTVNIAGAYLYECWVTDVEGRAAQVVTGHVVVSRTLKRGAVV